MQLHLQVAFKENEKMYNYLKENSYYFKELNRETLDFKQFTNLMKEKYKERTTDKINNLVDNMDLITSVLNILK